MNILTLVAILAFVVVLLLFYIRNLWDRINELESKGKSASILHGMKFEQFAPFMKDYPYNPRNFRFIGSPIDGVQFEDNSLIFVDFKTGKSKLSENQKRIMKLVEDKKVSWKEIRL